MAGRTVLFTAANGHTDRRELPPEAFRFGPTGGLVRFEPLDDRDAAQRADPFAQLRDERDRLQRQVDAMKAKVRALRAQLGLPPEDEEPAAEGDAEFSAWFGKFAAREWPHAPTLRASPLVRAAAMQRFHADRPTDTTSESILVRLARGSRGGGAA